MSRRLYTHTIDHGSFLSIDLTCPNSVRNFISLMVDICVDLEKFILAGDDNCRVSFGFNHNGKLAESLVFPLADVADEKIDTSELYKFSQFAINTSVTLRNRRNTFSNNLRVVPIPSARYGKMYKLSGNSAAISSTIVSVSPGNTLLWNIAKKLSYEMCGFGFVFQDILGYFKLHLMSKENFRRTYGIGEDLDIVVGTRDDVERFSDRVYKVINLVVESIDHEIIVL